MSKRKKVIVLIIPALFGLVVIPCNLLFAQTLQEAVAKATQTHPKILAAQEEKKVFELRTNQALSGYFPVINLSAAHGEEWTDSPSTRSSGVGGNNLVKSSVGITLSQMIFDGLDTKHKVDQAKAKQRSNLGVHQNDAEKLTLKVANAYLDALKESELLDLQEKNLTLHKEILSKVKEMEAIGAGTQVDVRQSDSRLALVASEKESALGKKKEAQTRFVTVVGEISHNLVRPNLKKHLLPTSKEAAVEMALKKHPSLITSQADLDAAIAEKRSAMSSFFPSISLELGASNSSNASGTRSYTKSASAMLELSYNLFRGHSDVFKKWEKERNVSKFREKIEETRRTVIEEVETAWHALQTAKKRVKHVEKYLTITQGVTASYHDQFNMGIRPLLDVLDSESELHNARRSLLVEQFEFIRGTLKLLSAMGILQETLSLPANEVMQSVASKGESRQANTLILASLLEEERGSPLRHKAPSKPVTNLERSLSVLPGEEDTPQPSYQKQKGMATSSSILKHLIPPLHSSQRMDLPDLLELLDPIMPLYPTAASQEKAARLLEEIPIMEFLSLMESPLS
ncbi:MAG: TolC family outer membrane protein [Magnetococcales bacterium]|nr:TolC family outer membrane protein [Magnetococcales bacterium]